ncbi:GFA family protein [Brevundimonas sp.]|uniref:GFA family protein n=1 Tax=Brevundimonas sp. TaxID=1871086 RepID=UPI002D4606AF|nr:GFA family protein [Brevundimonas sp.]HYC75567.1 GFA family protein [Brevundimonas sp.]
MTTAFTGRCLCGAVSYSVEAEPGVVGDCYCTDCRRTSGTSHCTHAVIPESALTVTGEPTFYERAADSGNVVRRGFCGRCGSAIYSTNLGMPGMAFIRVSSMDDPDRAVPQMTVYASRAPSWAQVNRSYPVFETMPQGGPESVLPET